MPASMLARWFMPALYFGLLAAILEASSAPLKVHLLSTDKCSPMCPPMHVYTHADGGVPVQNSRSMGTQKFM